MKIFVALLILCLFLLCYSSRISVMAIDDKTPSLKVIYKTDKASINPGEIIKVDVYFPGDGNISLCRCSVYYNGELFDDITYSTEGAENETFDMKNNTVNSFQIPNRIFSASQNYTWFPPTAELGEINKSSGLGIAPLRFWLHTKTNINSGNYFIILFLSYTDGKEWFTYEKNIEFHVKSWVEQNEYGVTIGSFIWSLLLTFLGAFLGFWGAMHVYHRPSLKISAEPTVTGPDNHGNITVNVQGIIKNKGNIELSDLEGSAFIVFGGNIPGYVNITFTRNNSNKITLYPKWETEFYAQQTFIQEDLNGNQGKATIRFGNQKFEKSILITFNR